MRTKVLALHEDARLPGYGYPGDAGMDLAIVGDHTINPGESRDLPTGVAVEMPEGHWGRITGRSSTLRKKGLFINEGVIDAGYRGELLVYVTNRNGLPVQVSAGDRLAQLIVSPVVQATPEWAMSLSSTARGSNGFGSTDAQKVTSPVTEIDDDPGPPVYLGGAVDLAHSVHDMFDWRHDRMWIEAGIRTYCPKCECAGIADPQEIIRKNMTALRAAPVAVFDLRSPSIGTPIEAWVRIIGYGLPSVIMYPLGPRSVFVDYMTGRDGVVRAFDPHVLPATIERMLRS